MEVRDAQTLFAGANYYKGGIDNDDGPLTARAVEIIEANGKYDWSGWSRSRRMIAAAQAVLKAQGFQPGLIDGYYGHNTREALNAFQHKLIRGRSEFIERKPVVPVAASSVWPRQAQMTSFYGPAGAPECTAGKVDLPFPFIIAWNKSERIARFSCHRKVEAALTTIFRETYAHYGENRMDALGLTLFGGCYNFRTMRAGSSLSTHAWGVAVDLDPERNQLRWGRDRAAFAKPDYDPFWAIVEAQGATSLGRVANMDWMHFQFASL